MRYLLLVMMLFTISVNKLYPESFICGGMNFYKITGKYEQSYAQDYRTTSVKYSPQIELQFYWKIKKTTSIGVNTSVGMFRNKVQYYNDESGYNFDSTTPVIEVQQNFLTIFPTINFTRNFNKSSLHIGFGLNFMFFIADRSFTYQQGEGVLDDVTVVKDSSGINVAPALNLSWISNGSYILNFRLGYFLKEEMVFSKPEERFRYLNSSLSIGLRL